MDMANESWRYLGKFKDFGLSILALLLRYEGKGAGRGPAAESTTGRGEKMQKGRGRAALIKEGETDLFRAE